MKTGSSGLSQNYPHIVQTQLSLHPLPSLLLTIAKELIKPDILSQPNIDLAIMKPIYHMEQNTHHKFTVLLIARTNISSLLIETALACNRF